MSPLSRPKVDPNWPERILGRYEMTDQPQEAPEPQEPAEEPPLPEAAPPAPDDEDDAEDE